MRLNVGCGFDVRDGWTNIDTGEAWWGSDDPRVTRGDAVDLHVWRESCEVVLLNHVLHLFDYDEAETVLRQCVSALQPGGRLIVVEADVLRVVHLVSSHDGPTNAMLDRLTGSVEPTCDGQLLRWITWHGTRRSLWSPISLSERLDRLGVVPFFHVLDLDHVVDDLVRDVEIGRLDESFFVVGVKK